MKKMMMTLVMILAAQNLFAESKTTPEHLRRSSEQADWSAAYGYSTREPVYVETNPEALYFERLRMKSQIDRNTQDIAILDGRVSDLDSKVADLSDRVSVLNYRVNNLGWRVDLIDLKLSWIQRDVRHLENHYHHYHFGCQVAYIETNTPLMKSLSYSNSNSYFGQIYAPQGKVEILRHGTYSWLNNSSDSAVLVRVVANWAGQNVGRVGFVNASSLRCF